MREESGDNGESPLRAPGSQDDVQAFYDEFSDSRMRRYLQAGNLRIERAIDRILPFVEKDSTVLEIGCGIGLIVERIATVAREGVIWACDISEKNILYARERVRAANVLFRRSDVLHGFDDLRAWISRPVRLVVMVDVIEHLPLGYHAAVFRNLRTVTDEKSTLILTFPSPQYQRHLRENSPEELQIVDEVVELPHLLSIAEESGFSIKHLSLEDVWLRNQYVHCVLESSLSLDPVEEHGPSIAMRETSGVIAPGQTLILVDQAQWRSEELDGRRVVPFLERDEKCWGPPSDDETAIQELERLRRGGASFMVFSRMAFWWLDHYVGFHRYLRSNFRCAVENERVVVFDLRS